MKKFDKFIQENHDKYKSCSAVSRIASRYFGEEISTHFVAERLKYINDAGLKKLNNSKATKNHMKIRQSLEFNKYIVSQYKKHRSTQRVCKEAARHFGFNLSRLYVAGRLKELGIELQTKGRCYSIYDTQLEREI